MSIRRLRFPFHLSAPPAEAVHCVPERVPEDSCIEKVMVSWFQPILKENKRMSVESEFNLTHLCPKTRQMSAPER